MVRPPDTGTPEWPHASGRAVRPTAAEGLRSGRIGRTIAPMDAASPGFLHGPPHGLPRRRRAAALAAMAAVGLSLAACAANPAGSTSAPDTTPTPSADSGTPATALRTETPSTTGTPDTGTGTGASASTAGCPAGGSVPDGAHTGATADLDGDGRPDTLWLSGGTPRRLGVETASGAVFSTEFTSAAPQAASALGARLGDGTAVVLLDTGRAVPLYAVIDCALVPTANVQGQQYTFDLGFTGYGTGVGCAELRRGLQLVGLKAESTDSGTTFTVIRTPIELDDHGASARNGQDEVVAEGVSADDPAVTTAQSVTCGMATAQVTEPVE
jgi:hypothetical protein